jgi:putative transposase
VIGDPRQGACPTNGFGQALDWERRTEKVSLEEHKRRERAQAIGLFRYQLICPALDEGLSTKQRGRLVREIAAGTHTDPFGNRVRISRETLDRWIRRYRAGGFEALVPAPWPRWPASCAPLRGGRPRSPPCCAISTGSI